MRSISILKENLSGYKASEKKRENEFLSKNDFLSGGDLKSRDIADFQISFEPLEVVLQNYGVGFWFSTSLARKLSSFVNREKLGTLLVFIDSLACSTNKLFIVNENSQRTLLYTICLLSSIHSCAILSRKTD